jgi:hypothetical protein
VPDGRFVLDREKEEFGCLLRFSALSICKCLAYPLFTQKNGVGRLDKLLRISRRGGDDPLGTLPGIILRRPLCHTYEKYLRIGVVLTKKA